MGARPGSAGGCRTTGGGPHGTAGQVAEVGHHARQAGDAIGLVDQVLEITGTAPEPTPAGSTTTTTSGGPTAEPAKGDAAPPSGG